MSSNTAIVVKNVAKYYPVLNQPSLALQYIFSNKNKPFKNSFRALNDISLEITKGETVGIVGKNGSGKSTLLQLIAGVLEPTFGQIETNGNIHAILELGAGFNPDFTGRENIFLYGLIHGLDKRVIEKNIDSIIDFAEIGEHIDLPVKTYSSGMYVRLAFAVTTQIEPDILLIDEALAVGDSRFQQKCYRRLNKLKQMGTTILMVSHQNDKIFNHCNRAILLNNGSMIADDTPKNVISSYIELMNQDNSKASKSEMKTNVDDLCAQQPSYNSSELRIGSQEAYISNYNLVTDGISTERTFIYQKQATIMLQITSQKQINNALIIVKISNEKGNLIAGYEVDGLSLAKGSNNNVNINFVNTLSSRTDLFITVGLHKYIESVREPLDIRRDFICFDSNNNKQILGDVDLNITITQV